MEKIMDKYIGKIVCKKSSAGPVQADLHLKIESEWNPNLWNFVTLPKLYR